jgi:hypothetical protein
MSKRLFAAAIASAILIPAAAQAQSRVAIPNVELFATVTGKWVLNPRACRDIREDVRDARRNEGRRDRREDRRDQRVADCPASAYTFVVDAGQGPKFPVRVGRGRVSREYRGKPMFINGDTVGPDGRPVETRGQVYAPVPQPYQPAYRAPTPTYAAPTVRQYQAPVSQPYRAPQPVYQAPQPTYQVAPQPTYQAPQPTYRAPQPTYQTQQPSYQTQQPSYQAPAAPSQPSSYRIENGIIIFD